MLPKGVDINGSGSLVVFLHSSLSSSKQWQFLASELSAKFTCINIDLLGYGEAEEVMSVDTYSFQTEADRICKAIESIQPEASFHLIGHSCGGAIALKIAESMPERILSLALYEPVAFHLYQYINTYVSIKNKTEEFAHSIASSSKAEATRIFVDYWNYEGFFEKLPNKIQQQMTQQIDKVNLDFKGIFSEDYSLKDLHKVSCPALVLYGKNSPDIATVLAKNIHENLLNSDIKEIPAGHMAPLTHAKLVFDEITAFYINF